MAENVTQELILEHLKTIQRKLTDMSSDMADMKSDLRGVKGHLASFMQSEVAQDNTIASMHARLDRIEKRLDLTDAT